MTVKYREQYPRSPQANVLITALETETVHSAFELAEAADLLAVRLLRLCVDNVA